MTDNSKLALISRKLSLFRRCENSHNCSYLNLQKRYKYDFIDHIFYYRNMVSTRSERYDTNTFLVRIVFVLKTIVFLLFDTIFDNCYSIYIQIVFYNAIFQWQYRRQFVNKYRAENLFFNFLILINIG